MTQLVVLLPMARVNPGTHLIFILFYFVIIFFNILNFTNYSGIVVNIVNIVILPGNFTGF